MLHSEQLKYHVVTIGIEQYLGNSDLYEDICLENIKKLYKYSGKCDDQHKYKAILESDISSTPKGITDNIPIYVGTSGTMENPSEINPPSQFLALLDFKNGSFWKNCNSIHIDSALWNSNIKRRRHWKIKSSVQQDVYTWVFYHTQIVQYPISNHWFMLSIDGTTEKNYLKYYCRCL